MKRSFYSKFKTAGFFSLLIALTIFQGKALAAAYYVVDSNPWGQTMNQTAMDNVFGAGNWTQANTSTPAATIFAAGTTFVMLEGSQLNTNMPGFITANISAIESWVAAGGRLFINAGPNYGSNQSWGFGGTTLVYPTFSNPGTAANPSNPVFIGPFTPTATSFTGGYFSHAAITGTGLTTIIYGQNDPSVNVVCYKRWGNGIAFFGGCTQPYFWDPSAEGFNVWQNIFAYVNTIPLQGIFPSVTNLLYCPGASITVDYTTQNLTFNPGNVLTVQLSDASGSFASPTVIGTMASTAASGSIVCTLPGAALGSGYRVRIISSDNPWTSIDNEANIDISQQKPVVTISVDQNSVCIGTSMQFTATTQYPGTSLAYAWYVNNNPVGTNDDVYNTNTLNPGDQVKCIVTTTSPCLGTTGDTSNTILAIMISPSSNLAGFIGSTESQTAQVYSSQDIRYQSDCDLMVTVEPTAPDPYYGEYEAEVIIDNVVGYYNGQPYVTRHFNVGLAGEPAIQNPPTANITLYAYQFEFDNYNAVAGPLGLPLLPTNGIDNGNVRVTQYHGWGTYPQDYDVQGLLIVPSVSWDAAHQWWVIQFPIVDFSGFFIHTGIGPNPLAISISDIKAQNVDKRNRIDWTTATEANGDGFVIERSKDGKDFSAIGAMDAKGEASSYTYWDESPFAGINYYRIKLLNNRSDVTYTNVVTATVASGGTFVVTAYPNPAKNTVTIQTAGDRGADGNIVITDVMGRTIRSLACNSDKTAIDISDIPAGNYVVRYTDDVNAAVIKVVKQ